MCVSAQFSNFRCRCGTAPRLVRQTRRQLRRCEPEERRRRAAKAAGMLTSSWAYTACPAPIWSSDIVVVFGKGVSSKMFKEADRMCDWKPTRQRESGHVTLFLPRGRTARSYAGSVPARRACVLPRCGRPRTPNAGRRPLAYRVNNISSPALAKYGAQRRNRPR